MLPLLQQNLGRPFQGTTPRTLVSMKNMLSRKQKTWESEERVLIESIRDSEFPLSDVEVAWTFADQLRRALWCYALTALCRNLPSSPHPFVLQTCFLWLRNAGLARRSAIIRLSCSTPLTSFA